MQCNFIKEDGEKCNANTMKNSDFCFTHNPDTAEQKMEAVRKGGLSSKPRKDAEIIEPLDVKNIQDVIRLLEDTINRIRTNPMTHQKANCIGYLANVMVRALETSDLEERMEAIEEAINIKLNMRI